SHRAFPLTTHHTTYTTSPSPDTLFFFLFNDPPPPEIYTLSLHDALPISRSWACCHADCDADPSCATATASRAARRLASAAVVDGDRKSTRLNSSHRTISYAVFCLKKKKRKTTHTNTPVELQSPAKYCGRC